MIRAGGFDEFGQSRTRQFWEAQYLRKAEGRMQNAEFDFGAAGSFTSSINLLPSSYGIITLSDRPFQATSDWEVRMSAGPNPTSLPALTGRFGLSFSLFNRLYSGNNYCSLFLLLLGCFDSERHRWPEGQRPKSRSLIRRSGVQRLHAPTSGISQLATSFFGIRAEPSTMQLSRSF